jgi:hypothetical protein
MNRSAGVGRFAAMRKSKVAQGESLGSAATSAALGGRRDAAIASI